MFKGEQFADEVKPEWEDPAFANGGCWKLKLEKQFTNKVWEDLVLALIGD